MVQVLILAASPVAPASAATASAKAAEDRGYIGVIFKFEEDKKTATVMEAVADGPASKAGLEVGDVITKIDGKAVDLSDAFGQKVGTLSWLTR